MKKSVRRLAFGALAAAAAMQFAACRNRPETVYGPPEYFTKTAPENNVPEVVYGPPEDFTQAAPVNDAAEPESPTETQAEVQTETRAEARTEAGPETPPENQTETRTETRPEEVIVPETDFTAEENIAECLYGPPEMLETWQQETGFVPETNEPVDVYGPPSMLGADDPEEEPEEETETAAAETSEAEPETVSPGTDFDPSRNEMITMYGPPEMFRRMESAAPAQDSGGSAESEVR